jgi:hypothetical protein
MKAQKLDINLPEYEKIFRILNGVSAYVSDGQPPSCQFYNVTGAYILTKIYSIDARPIMGAAFIKLDQLTGNTLAFADSNLDECNSHSDAFHCWIETPNFYIDFTAPVYGDYPNSFSAPRYMFQKQRIRMSPSHLELNKSGDFYLAVNKRLTNDRLKSVMQSTKFDDFAEISIEWARQSKKTLLKEMQIQADDGEIIKLKASQITLTGAW